ncbi:hypothetical protein MM1S1540310_2649 [Mycobacteroides abscessus subsp. bolletii 1S-154-0310]|uniref:Uncharacterized protein n=1 Tax=Mycobacteroides abscessus MAB_091912_2446 TaxID=1335414 RepID=A0A829MJA8_9MYCO|nr:hypothetical protein [Mycobacteroides abscessus]EIU62755.1 hypothetical protein MM1S1510930_3092 [Mycobacteroides abscessus subsp. bolletii 1S-151-0930]EIU81991.1 hypothetical protein MM2B0626_3013 [Mycobacteroides abscessus subsp. bolletii 2B-0626]EIV17603.1 hypothetical protein MM2B0912R_0794 [Mycobacteroides abscessus subsp. bolletii 2B-0912-R]EIV71688.1 hypothetical protein MM2B1231_3078 [Mycobacteroides abscessus subsp. bolletii 2B-1231]EIV77228.1 hypothetical protein MM2B0107_2351 [My
MSKGSEDAGERRRPIPHAHAHVLGGRTRAARRGPSATESKVDLGCSQFFGLFDRV